MLQLLESVLFDCLMPHRKIMLPTALVAVFAKPKRFREPAPQAMLPGTLRPAAPQDKCLLLGIHLVEISRHQGQAQLILSPISSRKP